MLQEKTDHQEKRLASALRKELQTVEKQEKKLERAARNAKPAAWRQELESRVPRKVYIGLESAFGKGFGLVFRKGSVLIEKTYDRQSLQKDFAIREFAVQLKGGRKELKQLRKSAASADLRNLTVTTLEGVGLGALGIGMPDIVLFLGNLLKGIYETALHYGFDYESPQEQLLILKMMETALTSGEDWCRKNSEVEEMLSAPPADISEDVFSEQIRLSASAFAVDMLLLKFLQGIPVVGILGGMANPVYYRRVMKYVELKYRKRYLLRQLSGGKKTEG